MVNLSVLKYSTLCALLLCIAIGICEFYGLWQYWGVPRYSSLFIDFQAMAASAECHAQGIDVFVSNPCDIVERRHGYSRIWFVLDNIGITTKNYHYFGFLMSLGFVLTFLVIMSPRSRFEFFTSAGLLLSPAVVLGIERANADLLVFCMLVLSAKLMTGKRTHDQIFAYCTICLAAMLKFYPLIAFSLYIRSAKTNRAFWWVTALSFVLLLVFIMFTYSDYKNIDITSPERRFTFGGRYLLQFFLTETRSKYIALCIWSSFFAYALFSHRSTPLVQGAVREFLVLMFIAGSVLSLFTFVMSNNYDYRCVFLLLCVPLLLEFYRVAAYRKSVLTTLALLFAVLWWEALVEVVLAFNPSQIIQGTPYGKVRFVEQILTWLLMVRIALMLGELLVPSLLSRFRTK